MKPKIMGLVGGLALIFAVGMSLLFINATPNTSALSTEDLSATALCVELTADRVALHSIFGTPTPNPNATPTPLQPLGNVQAGQGVFTEVGKCHVCHEVSSMEELIAPSLMHIASNAMWKREGISAEDYVRGAILRPNELIVPSLKAGIMPTSYEQLLTQEQLNDLVAYLMTLE